eukprot:scaffold244129_cov21-Tisochrysis_lutea.AAC.1
MGNVFGLFGPRLEMTGQAWGCCAVLRTAYHDSVWHRQHQGSLRPQGQFVHDQAQPHLPLGPLERLMGVMG